MMCQLSLASHQCAEVWGRSRAEGSVGHGSGRAMKLMVFLYTFLSAGLFPRFQTNRDKNATPSPVTHRSRSQLFISWRKPVGPRLGSTGTVPASLREARRGPCVTLLRPRPRSGPGGRGIVWHSGSARTRTNERMLPAQRQARLSASPTWQGSLGHPQLLTSRSVGARGNTISIPLPDLTAPTLEPRPAIHT